MADYEIKALRARLAEVLALIDPKNENADLNDDEHGLRYFLEGRIRAAAQGEDDRKGDRPHEFEPMSDWDRRCGYWSLREIGGSCLKLASDPIHGGEDDRG